METKRKKLPIGVEFFQDFNAKNFYYIDKTGFIRDLLESMGSVNLFTRPRRFGKSLNMDMLKTFFEIGTEPSLFNGLEIAKYPDLCQQYLGKYPVISISLKDVASDNFIEAKEFLCDVISEEANRFDWLMDSPRLSKYDKTKLEAILSNQFETTASLYGSLKFLSRLLYKHYGKQTIVFIDEYDVPLDKAYQNNYYPQMVQLIRSLFSQVLKTNPNLYFAVITGCLRIAKESIFTGLNNFKVRTISDVRFAEYFGFTETEVNELLSYYNLEEKYEVLKEWYDGYHFGQIDVYCPWDVINQCDKFLETIDASMEAHWENSSSNAIVQDILENSTATTKDQIEALISGECIEKELIPELTYMDLDSSDPDIRQNYLWSMLFSAGYLTETGRPENELHKLVIPNREVLGIYERKIRSWFKTKIIRNTARWQNFCDAVKTGNPTEVQSLFNEFLSDSISIRDSSVKKEMKENFYHGILLGLLQAEGSWIVKSNFESGIGYTDILIEIPSEKIGCIIEVKYAEKGAYNAACTEAMKQIQDNDYTDVLKKKELQTIHEYGIACYKKKCKIVYKSIKLFHQNTDF